MPLGKNADAGDYVKDFYKSKAPQFKGKSKNKRRQMAIAAYLDARDKGKASLTDAQSSRANAAYDTSTESSSAYNSTF